MVNPSISLGDIGPKLEGWADNLDGTHILNGDTERSFVYKLSYQYDPILKTWDGKFENKLLDPSVYVYHLLLMTKAGKMVNYFGDITLVH